MRHRHISLHTQAEFFIDAFLLGNGSLGATTYGRPGVERFDLNADTFWSGGPIEAPQGNGGDLLRAVCSAVQRRDFEEADRQAVTLQGKAWAQSYQPIGGLLWDVAATEIKDDNYARVLDLDEAESRTSYVTNEGGVAVHTFVSAVDGIMVASATGDGVRSGRLEVDIPHPHVVERLPAEDGEMVIVTGRAPALVLPNYVDDPVPIRYGDDSPDEAGLVDAGMGFAAVARIQRLKDGSQRLLVAVETGFRGYALRPSADIDALVRVARKRVQTAALQNTVNLRKRHVADFRTYTDRADLDLSASDSPAADAAELFFHFGRYLFISSSRPGTEAANLQGIWNIDMRPGWSSNYTTNINAEMNYWAAEILGLPDCHEPFLKLIRSVAEAGRATAMAHYGLEGSTLHHNTDIWAFTAPVPGEPQWANWPTGLLWFAAHVLDSLEFAGPNGMRNADLFVTERALTFALGLLVDDGTGELVLCPSTSPENRFISGGAAASVSAGAAMDQEMFAEVATRYLDVADGAGDLGLAGNLSAVLPLLARPAIGPDGRLLEWHDESLQPSEHGHRHLSHLWGLHPGRRITELGSPVDFAAAASALACRLENGSGYTGWSQAWVLCMAARLRDQDLAERSLDTLLNDLTSSSLLDLHPHPEWPGGQIFQIDGNFGAVAGIAELLVQSHEGAISVLKTLPATWKTGKARGFRARGGHRVDLEWADGLLASVTFKIGGGGHMIVDIPASSREISLVSKGEAIPFEPKVAAEDRQRIVFRAIASQTYSLEMH